MTEDIGSDAHKRPQEIEIALLKERAREASKRDTIILAQLDIVISKCSKMEVSLALGEREFEALNAKYNDTTDRLDIIEAELKAATKRDPVALWTSIGAAGTAVGGFLYALFHGFPPAGAP